eukprot:8849255-Pyramimonas_sp.AAC.1
MSGSNQHAVEALLRPLLGGASAVAPLGWPLGALSATFGHFLGAPRERASGALSSARTCSTRALSSPRGQCRGGLRAAYESIGERGGSDVRLDIAAPFRPKAWATGQHRSLSLERGGHLHLPAGAECP